MKKLNLNLQLLAAFLIVTTGSLTATPIVGPTDVCAGFPANYSVAPTGIIYYWNVTPGTSGTIALENLNNLQMYWQTPGTETITVVFKDALGVFTTCSTTVVIHPTPNPDIVAETNPQCMSDSTADMGSPIGQEGRETCILACDSSKATYTTPLNPGNTYTWTVTGGGTICSGLGTNSIQVFWTGTGGDVKVVETNVWGCTDSSEICVELTDRPLADFDVNDVCNGQTAYFIDQSLGGPPLFYDWNFGDPASGANNNSTIQNPTHVFSGPGTYTVTLIVMNECYCRDTVTKTVNVSSDPGPDIFCPTVVCQDSCATYSTSANCGTYTWMVTGGTITSGLGTDEITVCWGSGPIGYVSLAVSGCSSTTLCPTPTIVPVPIIPQNGNIIGPAVVCEFTTHKYSLPCWPGVDYTWTVTGNGAIGNNNWSSQIGQGSHEIEVDWFNAGTGTVSVTYYNKLLDCGGSATFNVDIKPEFGIIGMDVMCVGSNGFHFSFQPGPFDWFVHDPSGTNIFTSLGTPSLIYTWPFVAGFYRIIAVPSASPNPYCIDTATFDVELVDVDTPMAIIGETNICPGETYSYTAIPTETGVTIDWFVTNGTPTLGSGNPINVTWTPGAGPYQISASQVQIAAPSCSSAVITLNVDSCTAPTPTITGGGFCIDSVGTFMFSLTGIPSKADIEWSLDNPALGSVVSGQGTNMVDIQWNSTVGSGNIIVDISICNHVVTATLPFSLLAAPPPGITPSGTLCPGGSVTLSVPSAYNFYSWSDGTNGPLATSIVVTSQGYYSITVTDINNCKAVSTIFVKQEPGPTVYLSTPGPISYCIPDPVNTTLFATESSPAYTYSWSPSLPATPTNTVTAPGTYTVTVTNSFGCTASDNITIYQDSCTSPCPNPPCPPPPGCQLVDPTDQVSFNIVTTATCEIVNFQNTSSASGTNFTWYFGDGTTLNQPTLVPTTSHTYNEAGFYIVWLCGEFPAQPPNSTCLLCTQKAVRVPVVADFEVIPGCVNDPFNLTFFNQLATTSASTIGSWSWSFPGGTPSSSALMNPPGVQYTSVGPHTASLTITDGAGICSSTRSITFSIPPPPVANFIPDTPCVNDAAQFLNASTGTIISYQWDFGDFTGSGAQNPFHTYGVASNYNVSLTVTDIRGCTDDTTITIPVFAPMIDTISYVGPLDICQGETDTLFAPTGGPWLWSNGCTTPFIIVNQTGSYSVIVTDINGCVYETPPVDVTVHPNPFAVIIPNGDSVLCDMEQLILTTPGGPGTAQWFNFGVFTGNTSGQEFVNNFGNTSVVNYSYTVVLTNAFGCTDTSAPFDVVAYPPITGVIIPSGPIDFCKGDSVTLTASPTTGFPPYTYTWSNGESGPTTTAFYQSLYTVTVTDVTGCEGVLNIQVDVYPCPNMCQVPTGCLEVCFPDTICGPLGEYAGYYTYEWLNLDPVTCNPIGTASTARGLIVNAPGKYSLVLTTPFGCTDTSDVLEVDGKPCEDSCFAAVDPVYQKILADVTYTTNTVFAGKYYVADFVQITVDGATLDLTNVDIVFGRCAGINFINGAFVRSNNSVYRSCELDQGWRGWEFRGGSSGIINESTFKNAQRTLFFWGSSAGDQTDARITNNLFENCKIAVLNVFNHFDEAITGNTFIIDGSSITYDYVGPNCITYLPYSNTHWGIYNFFSEVNGLISQNDFIQSTDPGNTKRFHGIFQFFGDARISENLFTNMYRSIDLNRASRTTIENNEIEITREFFDIDHQIRASRCDFVHILGNEIRNTREYRSFTLANSAIYVDNFTTMATIKENKIEGFANGIILNQVNNSYVGENSIYNSNVYGIYLKNTNRVDVACNVINMDQIPNAFVVSTTGIGYFQTSSYANQRNVFRSNCILETENAIFCQAPPPSSTTPLIPRIVNNYLYNYQFTGVTTINFGGNIGSALSPFTSAGRNTFISNDYPSGAIDVANSGPYAITVVGNWDVLTTSGIISLGPSNVYHSTASCGHQIEQDQTGTAGQQEITADEICDPFKGAIPIFKSAPGETRLEADYMSYFDGLSADEQLQLANNILLVLSDNSTHSELDQFYASMSASVILNKRQKNWLDHFYHFNKGAFTAAQSVLNKIQPADQDESELQMIRTLILDMMINDRELTSLSESEIAMLEAIDGRGGIYASEARDILHAAFGEFDHLFEAPLKATQPIVEEGQLIDLSDEFLDVHPNPARDEVYVQYFVEDISDASFVLYNAEGRMIRDVPVTFNASQIKLDIRELNNGVYLFVIENSQGVRQRAKIIKN